MDIKLRIFLCDVCTVDSEETKEFRNHFYNLLDEKKLSYKFGQINNVLEGIISLPTAKAAESLKDYLSNVFLEDPYVLNFELHHQM